MIYTLRQGDTDGSLIATLTIGGVAVDLRECLSVVLFAKDSSSREDLFNEPCVMVDAGAGRVEIVSAAMLSYVGTHTEPFDCVIKVTFANGKIRTFPQRGAIRLAIEPA